MLVLNGAELNHKNCDFWAPLHLAVRKSQEQCIQAIVEMNEELRDQGKEEFDLNI